MERIFALIIGYCIGNIQSAYLITKFVAKIDIREQGSGNAGATNVLRTLGAKYGILVLILDILKSILACTIVGLVFKNSELSTNYILQAFAGLGAVLGHNFPFVLQFKGGKGAATTLGFLIYVDWRIGLFCFLFGLSIIGIKRYVSLGSIIGLCTSTFLFVWLGYEKEFIIISLLLSVLTVYQHRANIKRLIDGTERKLWGNKK